MMRSRAGRRSRRRSRAHGNVVALRAGFTLVELIVAILILTVGVLGLAGTAAVVTRQMGGGRTQTLAAAIAQSRFDSLAALGCNMLPASGSVRQTLSSSGITEVVTVSDSNDTKFVIDTIRIPGRNTPLVYRSYISCRD